MSKSPIRIAYENMAALVAKDAEAVYKVNNPQSSGAVPMASHGNNPRQEVIDQLGWSHILEVARNYEQQITYNQERFEIAKEMLEEWRAVNEERQTVMMQLFKMLPPEEQDALMLEKLSSGRI